jgi:RecA/RadA recombinase
MQALQQYGNGGRQHNITQNSISCRVESVAVESPISAWEMHCATQQWRHAWQYPEQATTCKQNQHSIPADMPLRPRLFLIRHRSEIQQLSRHQNSHIERLTSQPRQQHQYDGGIWELGNGITELSGEGGSGKTQICLSLCVTCVMMRPIYYQSSTSTDFGNQSGIDVRLRPNNEHYMALYISMGEGIQSTTVARRLEQMVQSRLHRPYPNNQEKQILSRIGLISLRNEEEFVQFVDHDLPNILQDQKYHQRRQQQSLQQPQHRSQQQQSSKIALIVFDGIAGFFRFSDPLFQQFQKNNSTFHRQRGSRLLHISSQLRRLSDLHDVPILITNQVTAAIPSSDSPSISGTPSGDQVVPALGLAWSNCVSTRYILQRKDEMMATVSSENCGKQNEPILAKRSSTLVRVRVARILQAVNMPQEREARFVIETEGVSTVA